MLFNRITIGQSNAQQVRHCRLQVVCQSRHLHFRIELPHRIHIRQFSFGVDRPNPERSVKGLWQSPWLGFSVIDARFRLSYLTMPKHGASKHALPEARRDSL